MYHKWQSYDAWFMRYGAWQTEFFVILDRFLPFYPTNNPKNQHFQRMEKSPEDIILHMCTKNDNHMMYGSWDIECDWWNFFVTLDHFLPFYPLNKLKNQSFEKRKKPPGDIIILNNCTINDNHMVYGSWHMKHDGQNFLWFWTITPLTTQKIKILKNWKKCLEIS